MAVEIKVPSVGESITEGRITRWLKKDGELVQADEPVFELETEKATSEIPSPSTGRLKIAVPEGNTVQIGAVVGSIDPDGRAAEPTTKRPSERKENAARPASAQPSEPSTRAPDVTRAGEETVLSPAARRLADESGVDPRSFAGSGKGGRITKEDVLAHLNRMNSPTAPEVAAAPAPAPGDGSRIRRESMTPIRLRIAERLLRSQQATATLSTFNEVDLSAMMVVRQRFKEAFREKHGIGLGLMSFFVKASVEALREYPVLNARIDGTDIVYQQFYDIGVAVSTDQGLMVPVVREADRLSFAEIERSIASLAQKAREGKIAVSDLQGGTFTITNGGVFGSLLSTPILNAPQSAILGMHSVQKRPVVVDEQVIVRPMMYLALSYDHRLIDGRDAVRFLVRIKECVEAPERLLLEV